LKKVNNLFSIKILLYYYIKTLMQNIILSWMRWTWKTTVWKELAKALWAKFYDLDIYMNEKVWSINDYIEKNGWDAFRNLEHESLLEILEDKDKKVISLWWWTIVFDRNYKAIRKDKNSIIFFLETKLENIAKRIEKDEKNNAKRASLTWKSVLEELEEVYKQRESIYKTNCDFIVSNNENIEKTSKDILKIINSKKVCVPIVNFENIDNLIKNIEKEDKISYVEFRIDFLKDLSKLDKLKTTKKSIFTNRIKKEWWNFAWTEKESLEIAKKSLELGADLVDLELSVIEKLKDIDVDTNKLIVSYHNFDKTPELEDLKQILERMKKFNPKVYKIAVFPQNKNDVETIYKLTDYFKENYIWKEFIFISMWELGMETRVKVPQQWWLLSFASFWKNISAPGQIDFETLYEKLQQF